MGGRTCGGGGREALEGMIVVVSGLPRSGTSLVMQMLAAGGVPAFTDDRRAADESNPRGYLEHERVKSLARDAEWIAEADGHAIKVIAPLLPFLPAGPAYRTVLLRRNMQDVLSSQAALLEAAGRPAARSEAVLPVFERHLAAAQAWAAHHADAWMELEHSQLIAAPLDSAQRLADFVGGKLDVPAMAACVDPALHRQRQGGGG